MKKKNENSRPRRFEKWVDKGSAALDRHLMRELEAGVGEKPFESERILRLDEHR